MHERGIESNKNLDSLMGFLPELKINGKQFAQLTPMLVYLSQIGKMDKLNPMEEFKSGMMIQTATDAFVGSEGFLTEKALSQSKSDFELPIRV